MGFIIMCVLITSIVCVITWCCSKKEDRKENTIGTAIVASVLFCILISVTMLISYFSYVGLKKDYININNVYSNLIHNYTAYANVPTGVQGGHLVSDLTDKKYEDYQDNLRYYITQTSNTISSYNDTVIGKETMKGSWVWSWVIYYPEKLKPLQLERVENVK